MIVVSDASPIIALALVGRLELLHALFGEVVIPTAVRAELLRGPAGTRALQDAPWLQVRAAADRGLTKRLEATLGPGEAEAITLALELRADLVLIDERQGRATAQSLGVRPMGLVGVVLEAKRSSIIDAVRPVLDDLLARAGFYLARDVYAHALRSAGESRDGDL